MYLSLLLILALQSARVPNKDIDPRTAELGPLSIQPGAVKLHYEDGLPIVGRLIFPFGVPQSYLEIEMEAEDGTVVRATKSGPNGEFRFDGVKLGSYYFIINTQGLDFVRQPLILDMQNFGSIRPMIQLRRLHGKSLDEFEDVVSIANLVQSVPKDAIKAVEKALEEQRKNDVVKMVAELERALKIAPNYYDANLHLGLHYKKAGQREQAVRLLLRAVEVNSASMKARAALGQLYFEGGEFQKAVDVLSEAARLGNTSPDLYFMLGTSHYKLGALVLAEESLNRTIVMSAGTMGETYLQLHNVYLKNKQLEKALLQLETYLLRFPDAPDRQDIQSRVEKLRAGIRK